VTGVDLVAAQLAVAAGEPLPWRQADLEQRGHAIECRIYAEDPVEFLPQAGPLLLYREPSGPGVRVDAGVIEGSDVSVHYDPLLAKLIVHAEDREAARRRALAALRQYAILGIETNVAFLVRLLEHPRFCAGRIDTAFVDAQRAQLAAVPSSDHLAVAMVAAAACTLEAGAPGGSMPGSGQDAQSAWDPWTSRRGWRG
jgi:acetyl/propionyl-CoA carboxylase alpha subunit